MMGTLSDQLCKLSGLLIIKSLHWLMMERSGSGRGTMQILSGICCLNYHRKIELHEGKMAVGSIGNLKTNATAWRVFFAVER